MRLVHRGWLLALCLAAGCDATTIAEAIASDATISEAAVLPLCQAPTRLRVVSTNIGAGVRQEPTCAFSSQSALNILAYFDFAGSSPDHITAFAMQEVDEDRNRSGTCATYSACRDQAMDFATYLDGVNGTGYCDRAFRAYLAPALEEVGGPCSGQTQRYGNAIVADASLQAAQQWDLSPPGTCRTTFSNPESEPECRGAAVARLDDFAMPVWVISTHLGFVNHIPVGEESYGAALARHVVDSLPADDLVVLSGDFNIFFEGRYVTEDGAGGTHTQFDGQHLAAWNELSGELSAIGFVRVPVMVDTVPTIDPVKQIDFVFVRDPQHRIHHTSWSLIQPSFEFFGTHYHMTDHLGVAVEFAFSTTPPALGPDALIEAGVMDAIL